MTVRYGNPIIDPHHGLAVWPTGRECVLFGKRYGWVRRLAFTDHVGPADGFNFTRLPVTLVRMSETSDVTRETLPVFATLLEAYDAWHAHIRSRSV